MLHEVCLAKIPSGRKMGLILSWEAILKKTFDWWKGSSVTTYRREGDASWTVKDQRAHLSRNPSLTSR